MVKRVWSNVGQVAGLLALFIVLGGPAWAAGMINGATIKPSSVTGKQIRNASLTGSDVKDKSLTGSDVRDGSLDTLDVKDGSLTGTDIGDGSIGAADIAPGVVPTVPPIPTVPPLSIPDGFVTTAMFSDTAVSPFARALPGLRTEKNATSPNIIGGVDANSVTAGAVGATVGGGGATGTLQTATDDYGTIAGGRGNSAGNATGTTSDAIAATVGGGESNTATGSYGTVPGGLSNSAASFSLAAGRRAKAVNTGSFVWADSTNANFTSTADNQVSFRAANGVFVANDAGGAKSVPAGTRYRDNNIHAWARVTAAGVLDSNFNIASVTRVSAGQYRFTLNAPLTSGFSMIPIVTVETDEIALDTPPTGAANVRLVATNQVAAGTTFDVYIYNGSFALVDNDFQVMVTGR